MKRLVCWVLSSSEAAANLRGMAKSHHAKTVQKNITFYEPLLERFYSFCEERGQPAGHSINAAMWLYLNSSPEVREKASVELTKWLRGGDKRRA